MGLADAGDNLMDANFDKASVNALILRLTKEEAWVLETCQNAHLYRQGPPNTFFDQVLPDEPLTYHSAFLTPHSANGPTD